MHVKKPVHQKPAQNHLDCRSLRLTSSGCHIRRRPFLPHVYQLTQGAVAHDVPQYELGNGRHDERRRPVAVRPPSQMGRLSSASLSSSLLRHNHIILTRHMLPKLWVTHEKMYRQISMNELHCSYSHHEKMIWEQCNCINALKSDQVFCST